MQVERLGGLAGIGLPGAHIRSMGELDLALLSVAEQLAVEALFTAAGAAAAAPARPTPVRDGFRYRITRQVAGREQCVEVHEGEAPAAVSRCVKDCLI
jgi:hypothetical protein